MTKNKRYKNTGLKFRRYGDPVEFEIDKVLAGPAVNFEDEKYKDLLNDLQANILKRHQMEVTHYYFLQFLNHKECQEFLVNLSNHLTTARQQLEGQTPYNLNIYLTHAGYQFLNLPKGVIPDEEAFAEGMQARTKLSTEAVLEVFEEDQSIHAVILLAYQNIEEIDNKEVLAAMKVLNKKKKLNSDAFKVLFTQSGQLENPLGEDFQFEDGISNPRFFPGAFSSTKTARHAIRATELSPMQLVLKPDHSGDKAYSCGSYGVFAKFAINEKAIEAVVEELQQALGIGEDLAKANILGRFMDGTPLSISDKATAYPTNDFNYQELINSNKGVKKAKNDNDGSRCPFHTHIRKANPRQKGEENRRIVRRGLFYEEADEKGLLFISFQNSLEEQFEYILNNWMLSKFMQVDEEYTRLIKTNPDILFSKAGEVYTFPKAWNEEDLQEANNIRIEIPETMITFKGGLYFFVPSISFFKKLDYHPKRKLSVDITIRDPDQHNTLSPPIPRKFPFIPGTEVLIHQDRNETPGKYNFIKGTVVAFEPKD